MNKKPLEELLDELKEELEDLIPVINQLQKDLPGKVASELQNLLEDLKIELQELNKIQRERVKKAEEYIAKAENTFKALRQSASEIQKSYENLNELIAQRLSDLINRLEEIENEIKNSAKEGVKEGLTGQVEKIRETLKEIYLEQYKDLVEIQKTLKAIRKEFDNYQNSLAETFERYQWSWLIPFIFLITLNLTVLLLIVLENANRERAVEILLGFLEVVFLISATYLSVEIWKKLQKPLVGYILSAVLLTIAVFIGYTTFKGKIQIVKVVKPSKPVDVITFQNSGEKCWVYKGYYAPNPEKPNTWNFYDQVICIPEK